MFVSVERKEIGSHDVHKIREKQQNPSSISSHQRLNRNYYPDSFGNETVGDNSIREKEEDRLNIYRLKGNRILLCKF